MATTVKSSDQITLVDLTDAYSVSLSLDSVSLNGGTSTLGAEQTISINVTALRGSEDILPSVGSCSVPSGSGITVTPKTPASATPLVVPVEIKFPASLANRGVITIPVSLDNDSVTIVKQLSYSISFKGTSVTISEIKYQAGSSATTAPTGTWNANPVSVPEGQYLWTRTTYSDGSIAYAVSKQGESADALTITAVAYAYQLSTSGTDFPTGTWQTTPQAPTTTQFAWTRTTTTYSDGTTAVTYTVGGKTGQNSTSYNLIVSHASIGKDASGNYATSKITLTAKSQTGTAAMGNYSGRFKIETTTDNSTWTAKYTSSSNQATYEYTIPAGIVAIRCSLYAAGGTTTLLDQKIIPVVTDGSDSLDLRIISSNGNIFKNTGIATTLYAHVYKGGVEITGNALTALGSINWYKDGASEVYATGTSISLSATDVSNKAIFEARLEA